MKVLQPQLKQADYLRTAWAVTPPAGTALQDILPPESWAHVAAMLRPRDVIEVMPEDSEWYALLIVRSIGANGPVLAVLHEKAFATAKTEDSPYEVKFAGGDKWRITRRSDGKILAKGLSSRDECHAWIDEHLTELA